MDRGSADAVALTLGDPFERHAPARAAAWSDVLAVIRPFARDFAWTLHVPGGYASGASFDDVIGYLAAGGRPFGLEDTKALHDHVRRGLIARFEGTSRMPSLAQLAAATEPLVIEWVLKRFDGLVKDTRRTPRLHATVAAYRRAGLSDKPLGQRTGTLRDRIASDGQVAVTY